MSDGICEVEGCDDPVKVRGKCKRHYMQEYRGREIAVRETPRYGPICMVEGCDEEHHSQGLCNTHYARLRRHGDVGDAEKQRQPREGTCRGPECDLPVKSKGLCSGHYFQESHGRPLAPIERVRVPRGTSCAVDGCGRPSLTSDGACRTHARYRASGDPEWRTRVIPDKAANGEGHLDPKTGYRLVQHKGRQVGEHRVVMEQILGRPLTSQETVHHRTGGFAGRSDNRPENLELWSGRHVAGHRVEDIVRYCREMLAVYGDEGERGRYAELAAAVLEDVTPTGDVDDGVPVEV